MLAVNRNRATTLARRVEKAHTAWSRLKGLLGRRHLPEGEALWLAPCRSVHTFGMGFGIDVLFLDAELRTVGLEENLIPQRVSGIHWKARSVLELPMGTLRRTETRVGDRIEIRGKEAS
jgi:uncharacterized membrane protein (UPF0127 family)